MKTDHPAALRAEIARLKAEVKLRDEALRQAKVAYWRWSAANGRLEYNRPEFYAVLGVPTDHPFELYDNCKQFVHPDDLARVNAAYDEADSAQSDFAVTYRLLNPDGSQRSVYEVGKAKFSEDGDFVGHAGIVQDVTAHKKTEAALEETREIFRRIADAVPLTISVKDSSGRILFGNRHLAERHGMSQAEIVGKTARDLIDDKGAAQVEETDRGVLETGLVVPFFEEKILIDGRSRDMLTTKLPIRGGDERVKFVATICLDISERKAVEEALRDSEQRFRGFTEAASDWFWEQDAGLRFTFLSDRHEVASDLPRQDILGRRRDEVFRQGIAEEEAQWEAHLATLAARRNFRDFVFSYRGPDGAIRVLRTSGVAVFDRDNRFRGYRGVGSDITAEVEERRRREAAEASLRQAQKMESIGQMTGGVAHDFNNLLAIIQGNAELLQGNGSADDAMLQAILRASRRGASLVQRMLAFSRQQALYPKAFDLDERVEQMLRMLRRTLGEAIEINFDPGAAGWCCLADAGQVDNAVLNLALNGRDAMPEGGCLEISSRKVRLGPTALRDAEDLPAGDYLVLSVKDDGCGIAAPDLENVFEPFFTTKEFGRGSGLGLSMVYGFAKQSGGT